MFIENPQMNSPRVAFHRIIKLFYFSCINILKYGHKHEKMLFSNATEQTAIRESGN